MDLHATLTTWPAVIDTIKREGCHHCSAPTITVALLPHSAFPASPHVIRVGQMACVTTFPHTAHVRIQALAILSRLEFTVTRVFRFCSFACLEQWVDAILFTPAPPPSR